MTIFAKLNFRGSNIMIIYNKHINNHLKTLGMTSQPPLTHLTKTLTMKKFYVFQCKCKTILYMYKFFTLFYMLINVNLYNL